MKTCNSDLQSQLQIENIDHLSSKELSNLINSTFLETYEHIPPLAWWRSIQLTSRHSHRSSICSLNDNSSSLGVNKAEEPERIQSTRTWWYSKLDLENLWGDSSIPDIQLVEYVLPARKRRKTSYRLEKSKHHSYPKKNPCVKLINILTWSYTSNKIAATCNKIWFQRMLSRNVDTCCLVICNLCVNISINMRWNQILLQVAAILLLM
jgi:hypothetical protein